MPVRSLYVRPYRPEGSKTLGRQSDTLPAGYLDELDEVAKALVMIWGRSAERIRPKVSASQLRALVVIERHSAINLMGLADELAASPSVTSRLCDRLQAAGLVLRQSGDGDRREVTIELSRDGLRLLRQLRQERQSDLDGILTTMTARERHSLIVGLNAFYAATAEHGFPDENLA